MASAPTRDLKTMAIPEEAEAFKTMAIPEEPEARKTMAIPEEPDDFDESAETQKIQTPFGKA
jgi:hypothetical protein